MTPVRAEDRRLRVQVLCFASLRGRDACALLTAAEEIAQIARVYRWPLAWGKTVRSMR
jgi:hypothetical protein